MPTKNTATIVIKPIIALFCGGLLTDLAKSSWSRLSILISFYPGDDFDKRALRVPRSISGPVPKRPFFKKLIFPGAIKCSIYSASGRRCFRIFDFQPRLLELVDSTFRSSFSIRFGLPKYRFACQTLGAQLRGELASGLLLSAILCEGFRGVLLLSKEAFGALFFF
jgi:hypothetical protein